MFIPGTQNNWSSHKIAKVLFVADGEVWYQKEGKLIQLIIYIFYCQNYWALKLSIILLIFKFNVFGNHFWLDDQTYNIGFSMWESQICICCL